MKLTVLVDNNTIIDQYYFAEPAVSYWIEDNNKKLLFDVGYSDIFIKNAKKLKKLPEGCRLGDNMFAFKGGFRLWD